MSPRCPLGATPVPPPWGWRGDKPGPVTTAPPGPLNGFNPDFAGLISRISVGSGAPLTGKSRRDLGPRPRHREPQLALPGIIPNQTRSWILSATCAPNGRLRSPHKSRRVCGVTAGPCRCPCSALSPPIPAVSQKSRPARGARHGESREISPLFKGPSWAGFGFPALSHSREFAGSVN